MGETVVPLGIQVVINIISLVRPRADPGARGFLLRAGISQLVDADAVGSQLAVIGQSQGLETGDAGDQELQAVRRLVILDIAAGGRKSLSSRRHAQSLLLLYLAGQHSDLRSVLQMSGMPFAVIGIAVVRIIYIHIMPVPVRPGALGLCAAAVHHGHIVPRLRAGVGVAHRGFLHADPADLVLRAHFARIPGVPGEVFRSAVVDVELAAQLQTHAHLSGLASRADHAPRNFQGMARPLVGDLIGPVVGLVLGLRIISFLIPGSLVGVDRLPKSPHGSVRSLRVDGHVDHHFGDAALLHHCGRRLIIAVRVGGGTHQVPGVVLVRHRGILPQAAVPVRVRTVRIRQQIDSPPLVHILAVQQVR